MCAQECVCPIKNEVRMFVQIFARNYGGGGVFLSLSSGFEKIRAHRDS